MIIIFSITAIKVYDLVLFVTYVSVSTYGSTKDSQTFSEISLLNNYISNDMENSKSSNEICKKIAASLPNMVRIILHEFCICCFSLLTCTQNVLQY